jgi:hypothetical protein
MSTAPDAIAPGREAAALAREVERASVPGAATSLGPEFALVELTYLANGRPRTRGQWADSYRQA